MSVLRGLDEGFEGGDEVGRKESGALLFSVVCVRKGLAFGGGVGPVTAMWAATLTGEGKEFSRSRYIGGENRPPVTSLGQTYHQGT